MIYCLTRSRSCAILLDVRYLPSTEPLAQVLTLLQYLVSGSYFLKFWIQVGDPKFCHWYVIRKWRIEFSTNARPCRDHAVRLPYWWPIRLISGYATRDHCGIQHYS